MGKRRIHGGYLPDTCRISESRFSPKKGYAGRNKGKSKIVPTLTPGAGVVTTRFQAQYIATEYGIVYLRNKDLAERAKALISIAEPSAREELEKAAVKRFGYSFLRLH